MLKNYVKIALRNLWKNKSYAFINLFGLSLAFACAILLFLTAHYELSFDHFHEQKDRIFKAYLKINSSNETEVRSNLPAPLLPALRSDYDSEIVHSTRILGGDSQLLNQGRYMDQNFSYVDPGFLKMFSFKMLKGTDAALNDPGNVVINQRTAEKIFGNADPMGKTIELVSDGKSEVFVVSGVTENAPDNSSVDNDMLIRFERSGGYQQNKDRWDSDYLSVYVRLADNVDAAVFQNRLKAFSLKYYKSSIEQLIREGARPDESGQVKSLRLLPITDEHFNAAVGGGGSVNIVYPYILLTISVLIVLIACINFINLSIARSFTRAREVGMRKALGAMKLQIINQFWGEAFILCLLSFAAGTLIAVGLMPGFNAMFRGNLQISGLADPVVIAILLSSLLIITFVAGGYPALSVTRFNTVEVLKGKVARSSRSGGVRTGLIIAQFSIAAFLMTCTGIIWQQIRFLRNMPLGFDREHVISIPVGPGLSGSKVLSFMRNEVAGNPDILSLSGADINIGRGKDGSSSKSIFGFEMEGKTYRTHGLSVAHDYVSTLGLQLIAGRDFSREFPSDPGSSIVINETMAKHLGFKDPVGRKIPLGDSLGSTIVGVVKDYHFESLKSGIEPITFFLDHEFGIYYIFVKTTANRPAEVMNTLEKAFKKIAPRSEFLPSYLDENTNNQYRKEERMSQIVMSAAILTIILSCMGLFAITIMIISLRTKEIGIRKVLGAGVGSLVFILSREFIVMVFAALLISIPLAWYCMTQWLTDFEYKTPLSVWLFGAVALLTIVIALLTVSFQSVRAALMNPVRSLKND